MRFQHIALSAIVATVVLAGCSDNGGSPTSSSDLPTSQQTPFGPNFQLGGGTSHLTVEPQSAVDEDFNCTNVQDVHVRFGRPGFVEDTDVGLFVEFMGVPSGQKIVRVWWDYEGEPGTFEDLDITDQLVPMAADGLFRWDSVLEHGYDTRRPTDYRVRVELISTGETGNCARVRNVSVSPDGTRVQTVSGHLDCLSGTGSFFGAISGVNISNVKRIVATLRVRNVTGSGTIGAIGPVLADGLFGSFWLGSPIGPLAVGSNTTHTWTATVPGDVNFNPTLGAVDGFCTGPGPAFDWSVTFVFVEK